MKYNRGKRTKIKEVWLCRRPLQAAGKSISQKERRKTRRCERPVDGNGRECRGYKRRRQQESANPSGGVRTMRKTRPRGKPHSVHSYQTAMEPNEATPSIRYRCSKRDHTRLETRCELRSVPRASRWRRSLRRLGDWRVEAIAPEWTKWTPKRAELRVKSVNCIRIAL